MSVARLIMVLLFAVCLPLAANASNAAKTVAVVNGVNLSEADLNQEIGSILPMNQSFHGKLSAEKMVEIRSDAMKNLVESELRAQDARASGIKAPQAEIDEELGKISKRFKSKTEFSNAYKNAGYTKESFRLALERRMLAGKAHIQRVEAKISVSPTSIRAYYDKNSSKYSKPEEFRASIILLKVDPAATTEERTGRFVKAEALLKKVMAGAKFEELAINESDDASRIKGGDLGYFHAGQLVSEFEAALVKLKVGEASPIVEILEGYLIIKLTDKRPPRQIPFDEIQEKIKKDLIESEKKQLLSDWTANLYKKAVITYPGEK